MAQHCGPTAAVGVVSRDPTFAPWTPTTSPRKQPSRTSVSGLPQARVSYGGMFPGRGQMSSTGADRTDSAPLPLCQYVAASHQLSS